MYGTKVIYRWYEHNSEAAMADEAERLAYVVTERSVNLWRWCGSAIGDIRIENADMSSKYQRQKTLRPKVQGFLCKAKLRRESRPLIKGRKPLEMGIRFVSQNIKTHIIFRGLLESYECLIINLCLWQKNYLFVWFHSEKKLQSQ